MIFLDWCSCFTMFDVAPPQTLANGLAIVALPRCPERHFDAFRHSPHGWLALHVILGKGNVFNIIQFTLVV